MIIFESLLITFERSVIFLAAWAIVGSGLSLKPNHHNLSKSVKEQDSIYGHRYLLDTLNPLNLTGFTVLRFCTQQSVMRINVSRYMPGSNSCHQSVHPSFCVCLSVCVCVWERCTVSWILERILSFHAIFFLFIHSKITKCVPSYCFLHVSVVCVCLLSESVCVRETVCVC